MPSLTVDYGAIVVGSPEIRVAGAACRYEVWYGETLEMLRCDVVRPDRAGCWRSFQRRAYRYLKIAFIALEGDVEVRDIRHHNAWYAYDARGALRLDDALAQKMIEVTDRTQRANSSYHYEDCPVREQALWVMDMRIMALVNAYRYGNHELTAKCLRQCFALQRPDGSVPSTGPRDNLFAHPDFMMHLTATLREYYQHTGDRSLVMTLLPGVRRIAAYLGRFKADSGLLDTDLGLQDPFLDWSFRIEKRGQTTILNALYTRFLADVAALETICGDAGAAKDCRAEAKSVGAAINRRLFWEERGVYRDAIRRGQPGDTVSQQGNLAALYAGIVPKERRDALLDEVWHSPEPPEQ
jgi:glycogen debranching enzyme